VKLADVGVEISSHPQTVLTASHHFAKPTASPSSRWRLCTVEHGRLDIPALAFCTEEGYSKDLHTSRLGHAVISCRCCWETGVVNK